MMVRWRWNDSAMIVVGSDCVREGNSGNNNGDWNS